MSKASRNVGIAVIIIVILAILFLPNSASSTVTQTYCSSTSVQTQTSIIFGPLGPTSTTTRTTSQGIQCYSTETVQVAILGLNANGVITSTYFPLIVANNSNVTETYEVVLNAANSNVCSYPVAPPCYGLGGEYTVIANSNQGITATSFSQTLPLHGAGILYLIGAGLTSYSGVKISNFLSVSW